MSRVYTASIHDYRAQAHKRVGNCGQALGRMKDTTTEHARGVRALLRIHMQTAKLWDEAPDDLPDEDTP